MYQQNLELVNLADFVPRVVLIGIDATSVLGVTVIMKELVFALIAVCVQMVVVNVGVARDAIQGDPEAIASVVNVLLVCSAVSVELVKDARISDGSSGVQIANIVLDIAMTQKIILKASLI